jgi:2-phospho-L-lactate guanylyltransferase
MNPPGDATAHETPPAAPQATVGWYDVATHRGSLRFDDGRDCAFGEAAFADSPFRLLRPGQRVRVLVDASGNVRGLRLPSGPP